MLQILNLFVEGQRLSNAVCRERTDWQRYNDREKRMVQNTVMLVGLLYKMCKLQLVIPAKTEGALNRVDKLWINRKSAHGRHGQRQTGKPRQSGIFPEKTAKIIDFRVDEMGVYEYN